jgi:serine/threonine-protein kinase
MADDNPAKPTSGADPSDRLMGWKAIAGHLQVSVRTAQRWERVGSLPVHRPARGPKSSVFAYGSELDDWWNSRGDEEPPEGAHQGDARSIAVLPFADLDRNLETEILADGLTEELINILANVPRLQVVARTSVFYFKGRDADVREIADLLGVEAVLEGSVRRSGTRVRVGAQLIDARTGRHLWSDRFDHHREDVFGIQDDIAHAIGGALRTSFAGESPTPPTRAYPGSFDTYEHYLEGRYHWNRRTPAGFLKAMECFERVLGEDPEMAVAWSALGLCYSMPTGFSTLNPDETVERALEAAEKALALDPGLAEPHLTLGFVHGAYRYEWDKAEVHFRRALDLEPGMAYAHNLIAAMLLNPTGRVDEADAHFQRALELDPFSPGMIHSVARQDLRHRRYDRAIEGFRASLALDPAYPWSLQGLGEVYILQGRYEEALHELAKLEMPTFAAGYAGYCQAKLGRLEEARHALRRLEESKQPGVAYQIAILRLGLDDFDGALEWLSTAFDPCCIGVHWVNAAKLWDPVRDDPRFAALISDRGMA